MKIIVCGSRDWTDEEKIRQRLAILPKDCIIIEGECRGADMTARDIAKSLGLEVLPFPADWTTYGDSAGPRRNIQMLAQDPDLVIAFHDDVNSSKGTKHMIKIAKAKGVPIEIIC